MPPDNIYLLTTVLNIAQRILSQVHRIGTPLRPIVSSINTFNYNLAKFLVKIIQPLTINEYTTTNTLDFEEEIKQLNIEDSSVMASFDVESLFIHVPLSETTQIITDSISDESISQFGLNKKQFNSFLNVATRDSVFTFDNKLYTQIDGVAMGAPLGPSYANAFLCHYECNWLNNCPNDFKPIFYKRYIDDTYLLFTQQSHIEQFLSYLNDQHPNIKFTLTPSGCSGVSVSQKLCVHNFVSNVAGWRSALRNAYIPCCYIVNNFRSAWVI
ncbi:uncharacterized protein [Penaeus vannamei]|uniref:uncharacterized protein n=1 Tax=Penaeus vannamei TaxID=6689 RepID=UPI00387F4003